MSCTVELSHLKDFRTGFTGGIWVHTQGGIINRGVACVCTKWRILVHFFAFLRFFVYFSGPSRRGGQNSMGGAKPREDGSETIFGDPPKTGFEGVKFWEFVSGIGGGGGNVPR